MSINPAYAQLRILIEQTIRMQEAPDMPEVRRLAAQGAHDYAHGANTFEHPEYEPHPDGAQHTVTLAGPLPAARAAALDLACRITGTAHTEAGSSQPDTTDHRITGRPQAIAAAVEILRLLQTQLDWHAEAIGFGRNPDDFVNAVAASWMKTTTAELAHLTR